MSPPPEGWVVYLPPLSLSVCVCACSKANAKRWEEECVQLRKGHAPKAAAYQEELQQLREENGSLKKEVRPLRCCALLCWQG